jgi:DNA repair exonuclease SbcCD nuclease subunit
MMIMRIAFISDAHLFQSFIKNYDALQDFGRVLNEIEQKSPDFLLIAGDMFDYKKTATTYLRHYEGEGLMIKIRNILKKFKIPIYAIRGNHEKEEVLKGLEQTVENFRYIRNDWVNFNNVSIYFMDTHYEGELYEPSAISQILKQVISSASSAGSVGKLKIILTHESFAPFENSLPKEIIREMSKVFNWIINGHMHTWNPKAYDLENVVTLPSLLPSRVVLGRYWMEKYDWESNVSEPKLLTQGSPFGYVLLDVEKGKPEFYPFVPSRKIVEISVDVTDLLIKNVIDRFKKVLDEIKERKDKDSLIILPEIHGYASFITSFIEGTFKEYSELSIEELRIHTVPKIMTPSGKIISPPILDVEELLTNVREELIQIISDLSEKIGIEITPETMKKILEGLSEAELLEKPPARTVTRLETLLSEILSKIPNIDKPEAFEVHMKDLIKKVKE